MAENAGRVQTQAAVTTYNAGDYLLFNTEDGTDSYAMSADEFKSMYVLADN